jgi:ribosomal protein S18 acetylase RimI-like enzyme
VQISNADARRFYERHGFKLVREIEGYYKKIEPRNAWLLEREVSVTDAEE